MKHRNLIAVLTAFIVCISGCQKEETPTITSGSETTANPTEPASDGIAEGVILHAWCWSFDTIRESMADIAAAGYTAVQTSPANEVIVGGNGGMQLMGKGKWYYQYQPTDWTVGNYQLGTEQEFKDMCSEADKYGIKVIVDVVPNHTAGDISAVSQSLIDAAGGIEGLYHKNYSKKISNYSSRIECTSYSLSGLPDVNTENSGFQDYFIAYLNRLIDDGADGFRFDAAKHIALPDDIRTDENVPNNFWERVTSETSKPVFRYGEVLQGDNDRIEQYIDTIGRTTASEYGKRLRGLTQGRMLNADMLSDFMVGGSSDVVTWVESHDNYTDGSTVNFTDTQIVLCWAVIAGRGDGTPLFFDRPYGAVPLDRWGKMNRIGAAGSPLYKSKEVSAVNNFRKAMTGKPTEMKNSSDNAVLMISRGNSGAVLVHYKQNDNNISEKCSLPDGEYTDRSGTNGKFNVKDGILTGTLAPDSIAVLYNEGYEEKAPMPEVSLNTDTFVIDGSLSVVLHVSGAQSGVYELGGKEQSFTDGSQIDIPAGTETLKLSATSANGERTVMTYYFADKQTVPAGASITFTKPESWEDTIYVYIYNETVSPVKKNAVWPGEEMTRDPDGTYSYTLAEEWDSALVIFNDGANQYPAAMEPGVELSEGMSYSVPG